MKQGRLFFIGIIGFVFIYIIYSMVGFGDQHSGRQAEGVQLIIEKALVQCYALEGSFPTRVEYVESYGVVFDYDRYVYFYEWFANNIMPTIKVIER